MTSMAVAIVLAVYMPPQAPAPGQASATIETAVFLGDRAGQRLAVALEGRDDVDLLLDPDQWAQPGLIVPAVDHDGRPIEAAHGHDGARHVLIATGERDETVVPLRSHHGFDGVSNEVSALEGIGHPIGSHRNAVGHSDRVEPHAYQVRLAHAFLDVIRKVAQVHIAWIAFIPTRSDTDLRLLQVGWSQASGEQHGLRCALAWWLRNPRRVAVEFDSLFAGAAGWFA